MRYIEVLRSEQVRAYLAKLELEEPLKANLDNLNKLLFAQLTHIPFDSLDVWGAGVCPSLALDDIYQKIVINGRGGYCFELNTLFRALLNALGFDAYQVAAAIIKPNGTVEPPSHTALLCKIKGQTYFLDAGYGGPVPYHAMELREGIQDGFCLRFDEDLYRVCRIKQGAEVPWMQFRNVAVAVRELEPLNFYMSQFPDIHFRHVLHLNRRNPDGSIYSVNGREFKIHTPTGCTLRQLENIDELKSVMLEYFGIDPKTAPLRKSL